MKEVIYDAEAIRDLKRHGNVAVRVRKAIEDYAAETGARANNVTQLVGSRYSRMRVGDYRAILQESATTIRVLNVKPRGGAYD